MKISDLKPRQNNVDVGGEVKSIEEVREFHKFGKSGRVSNAILSDDSGEIKLTLWNDDIDKIKVGSKVKITNGYVNEFQGEKQLTSGRFGKLEVVEEEESEAKTKKKKIKS